MSTKKKIKTDNNNKIFQDFIDFEILRSLINYLLINKTNNNNNNNNKYKISKFYLHRNEILNYILVSKKWYNFISLTISNNIINNKSFEHWLKINNNNNNKSFTKNYNNQNRYDKNNLIFNNKYSKNKIGFNKEFSIIKIKESIIKDYFKFNLFLSNITIDDFKEIKNKFENNQLVYNRIVVDIKTGYYGEGNQDEILFKIHEYVSNENSEIISNLFKILELNHDFMIIDDFHPKSKEEDEEDEEDDENDKGSKKCTEIYLNNLLVSGYDLTMDEDEDRESLKIFKIFKSKNIFYDGSGIASDIPTHVNYSALFDPDNSGQQVESIKVKNELEDPDFVEPLHLIKVNQFKNLHSITIPINSFQILSNLSEEMGYFSIDCFKSGFGLSDNMKSELNQMINSFITSKSLKNLKITSISTKEDPIDYDAYYDEGDLQTFMNQINEPKESFSNCFKPLFSELNTSIERIEFDCCGLLNINTFSNLLNNKSIKYLYLYDSDFFFSSLKTSDGGSDDCGIDDDGGSDDCGIDDDGGSDDCDAYQKIISINQYLFENIFSSPLTSIRHYRIKFKELDELKFIFNLILNNIFKLQLYSLIFEFNENELVYEFVKEFKNLINNISIQEQQQQQQKSNNINLKEIKIIINDDCLEELNNPYFKTTIKNSPY
ncbi:hypothetical protein DDB_G0271418 [Dictyostelium discoideum AX4]|uniref:Uncharacterized protein n=1 Tax=Dictyostelium discoideum TaxID=44689 RepID=Q54AV2_DICDI|nr:hypothetical protein DDB_G0294188 [Dictyostelium discoideum AX4]XP_645743.1 hypothetical protein DDB_G0271418 [Dictyostelium discoideum AX4]EAL60393.1 hypothetical protein DDB_G0294188 [Dictyostelium discoideum AX4]EAL71839.1 hypothetical protein DDB_G0271418 [Dictyostelium discoideum AX4]|eukprot:XP_628806.1 hypothetical protein DDB_G0294188 [Dictyostelium discoideum AX4]